MPEDSDATQELAQGCLQVRAPGSIQLTGVIDVTTVVGYRDAVLEQIGSNDSHRMEIDLSELEIHGTAVIALLISVVRESRKIQMEVLFRNCPEGLLAVAGACGVTGILGRG